MKELELGQKVKLNQKGKVYEFVVKNIHDGNYKLFNKFFHSRYWSLSEIEDSLS